MPWIPGVPDQPRPDDLAVAAAMTEAWLSRRPERAAMAAGDVATALEYDRLNRHQAVTRRRLLGRGMAAHTVQRFLERNLDGLGPTDAEVAAWTATRRREARCDALAGQ